MNFFARNKTAVLEPAFDAPTSAVEDITGDYTIDPTHTRLGFSARHAMVTTVRGQSPTSPAPPTSTPRTPPRRRSSSPSRPPASTPALPTVTAT